MYPPPPPPTPPPMDITPPPPISVGTTTTTTTDITIPQPYNNGVTTTNIASHHHHHHHSSSPITSAIIIIIIISSAIIVTAIIYFLIRRCKRPFRTPISPSNDVASNNRNENENQNLHHHAISISNNEAESLPLFTFSSLTGKIAGGDCAVCLSKFEGVDQLRLLPLCCHAFHAQCIDVWLKSNQTCPLCRSTVNPTEDDILNKLSAGAGAGDGAGAGGGAGGNRSNSFRIEIGTISNRRDPSESDRRSYSIGSYEYVLDDGYEIPVESTHRRAVSDRISGDKDATAPAPPEQNLAPETAVDGGSGHRNWFRDYVDRVSVSLSSRTMSFRGSGRFFTGSSRRSEVTGDFEATHGGIGEEISELFRWLSGV